MVTLRTTVRRAAIVVGTLAVLGQSRCSPILAPQAASIVVRVTGVPNDPGISLGVFVRDLAPPHNRLDKPVAIGGEVQFDNLGEGFELEVGVADLTRHGCRLIALTGTFARPVGGSFVNAVRTQHDSVDTVTAQVSCRSASVDVVVSGLPAGEAALVDLVSPSEPQPAAFNSILARNGSNVAVVFPDQRVSVEPQRVIAGGRVYSAPGQVVSIASRERKSAMVTYAPIGAPTTTTVTVVATGVPADTGIKLTAFTHYQGTPVETATIPIGGAASLDARIGAAGTRAGLAGLGAYGCVAIGPSNSFTTAGDTVFKVFTPRADVRDTAAFQLRCKSAALDITIAGLPAPDSAGITVRSSIDTATVRARNGVTRLTLVPHDTVRIAPASVSGSDGLFYQASAQTIALPSRRTTSVTVQYSAAAVAPACIDRPIAWYPLDGNGTDASGNGNDGTVVGAGAVPDRRGTRDSALLFNGMSDVINLGDRFNRLALPFSIAMWTFRERAISAYGYPEDDALRSLFATDDQPNWSAGIFFQVTPAGMLQINYGSGGQVGAAARRTLESTEPIRAGEWVHVAATVRGPTDMTLYVNGAAVAGTFSGTGGALAHSSFPARIGSFSLTPDNMAWRGRLDDVRLYDCSLSASEVAALFTR